MAIDLEAIKRKLDQLNKSTSNEGSSTTDHIWKPSVGSNKVRIVPYVHDKSNPFLEVYSYFGLARYILTSPVTYGDPCPIAEFSQKLKRSGNDEDYALSKKLEPKLRVYLPVLVRGEEDKGVKFWGFGTQVYTQILTIMSEPDYGDISDPKTGRDITIRYERPEGAPAWQAKTTIMPAGRETPMTDSGNVVEAVKNMPKMEDLFKPESYEELSEKLMAYINVGGPDPAEIVDDDDDDSPTPMKAATKKESSNNLTDVTATFNEMFAGL